jgi:hypothetical protein
MNIFIERKYKISCDIIELPVKGEETKKNLITSANSKRIESDSVKELTNTRI